ncbi:MAG: hypothetical protein A4E55_01587 [Pelotomaculum sp. PtaU1.Bin035]|nr:MAG: hypothetical protein A4E55_01587 [Pelotomaculum sp. PtaU1.Bin035]
MGPFDRALLTVYTFFFTVVLVLFSAVMLGWTAPQFLLSELFYPGRPEMFWPLMVILILAGAKLFWTGINKPVKGGKHVVLTESALGQVRVSLKAVENLVEKVVSQVDGIREVKPRIVSIPQGVGIHVCATVTPEINVPEVSLEVQNQVKERVFEVTGISISTVKVSIENISARRPRVE